MANDVFETVTNCNSCTRVRDTLTKVQKEMQLILTAGPLDFVAMDLLVPIPKSKKGYVSALVITDRFSKLARAAPMRTTTADVVADAIPENWFLPYGISKYLLKDNGTQFVGKLFEILAGQMDMQKFTTTAYHPLLNGQAESYNRTLVTCLRNYVSEHQHDSDRYVQTLTSAYNMQLHRSTVLLRSRSY